MDAPQSIVLNHKETEQVPLSNSQLQIRAQNGSIYSTLKHTYSRVLIRRIEVDAHEQEIGKKIGDKKEKKLNSSDDLDKAVMLR